jgi:DNA-binding transcriptional LysR family regulator
MALDVHPQLLRALRAVLETGSFTAASERLGFTQSALSKQIAALESAAGVPLLTRLARGVEPTAAGRALAARADTVLDQLDAAERDLRAASDTPEGRVVLGGFPATAMRLVPRAMARLRATHPAVHVEFVESSTPVQVRRLRAGRLDLAIIAEGSDLPSWSATGMRLEELLAGPLLVAVADGHRLANRGRVDVSELTEEVWVAGRGARGEAQFGVWPTLADAAVAVELREWSARIGFVAAGLGVTTVPTLVAAALPSGVSTVRVDDPGFAGRSLLLARVGELSPAASAVRDTVVAEAHRIAASVPTSAGRGPNS